MEEREDFTGAWVCSPAWPLLRCGGTGSAEFDGGVSRALEAPDPLEAPRGDSSVNEAARVTSETEADARLSKTPRHETIFS